MAGSSTSASVPAQGQRSVTLDILKTLPGPNVISVNRFWSGTGHEHFYTSAPTEKPRDFSPEGILCYVLTHKLSVSVALYRLIGPRGHHFYTTSEEEKVKVQRKGYHTEGVVGYVFNYEVADTSPIYLAYNETSDDHFYTLDRAEYDAAIAIHHYKEDKIVGYAWSKATFDASP